MNRVIDVPFALAVTAGMVATVNPCGFAMLPAYLGFFVGVEDPDRHGLGIGRALGVTAVMTAGFVTVFATIGLAVSTVAQGIDDHLPKLTVGIGIVLVGLGVWLLSGRELTAALPKLQRGGRDRTLASMYLFGVSYATASLSCTLGPFLVVLTPTFRASGVASGTLAFVAYALGMGLVLGVVTIAVSLARTGTVRRLRQLLPAVNRISGALLVLAGAYVAYYGAWELRGSDADPLVDRAQEVRDQLAEWVEGLPKWLLVGTIAVAGLVAGAASRRRRRARDDGRMTPEGEG